MADHSYWVAKRIKRYVKQNACATCGAESGQPCLNREYWASDESEFDAGAKPSQKRPYYQAYVHAARVHPDRIKRPGERLLKSRRAIELRGCLTCHASKREPCININQTALLAYEHAGSSPIRRRYVHRSRLKRAKPKKEN